MSGAENEEARILRLLTAWLAIEHNKTRLQAEEYKEAGQELYDYLLYIGFRLSRYPFSFYG